MKKSCVFRFHGSRLDSLQMLKSITINLSWTLKPSLSLYISCFKVSCCVAERFLGFMVSHVTFRAYVNMVAFYCFFNHILGFRFSLDMSQVFNQIAFLGSFSCSFKKKSTCIEGFLQLFAFYLLRVLLHSWIPFIFFLHNTSNQSLSLSLGENTQLY